MADTIRAFVAWPGRGLGAALSYGLTAAHSDLVARMDANDILHPLPLRLQHGYLLSHPQVTLLASQVKHLSHAPPSDGLRHYLCGRTPA
jgi:hypothetical protein